MAVKEPTGGLKKACWKGYTAVGMKMKNGRKVPNCVPANEEREIPLSHRTKHDVSHYRVLNNGRDVSKHDSYEEAIAHAGEHRRRLKSKGYDADKISVHAYVKEEKENYGLPAHSMKHVMQKIKDGHWEVSSGEVKSGQHLSIIDHTKGKKKRMIHVKEESNEPKDREWGTTKLTKRYKKDTPGQCDCNTMKEEAEKQTHLVKVTVSEPSLKSAEPMLKGVRVRATSEGEAIKRAKSHFRKAGYKVHDAYHHSTITTVKKAGQMDEGMTKAINKKNKNTLSAMRGRAALGAPEKGLSWQQNKAKAIKAGREMAKEEVNQVEEAESYAEYKAKHSKQLDIERKVKDHNNTVEKMSRKSSRDIDYTHPKVLKKAPNGYFFSTSGLLHMKEEVEQMEEGTVDLTKTLIKKIKAKGDTAYRSKKTGLLTLRKTPMKEELQVGQKVHVSGITGKHTGVIKKIRSASGGNQYFVKHDDSAIFKSYPRHKISAKEESEQIDEAGFKLSRRNSGKYREHKFEHDTEERMKNRPSYQGYHTQIHVDGRHYKAGDRMGGGEKGAQDAGRHAANIAKKTGKKVSLHMIHHETGKTLAIADHEDGKWKYRNLSEAAPIQKQPKAGVEKLVSKMNPDTKAKTVSETRNIIREVIKKAVDKQETNKANGKTATGEPAPKIQIDPVIDLGANNRGIGGT